MFSLGRLPKLTRDREAALEFDPIGQRVISPEKQNARPVINRRVPLTAEKIDNTHLESSFDETSNHFDTSNEMEIGAAAGSPRLENIGWGSLGGKLANTLDKFNQITNQGQNSIQELKTDSQQIREENLQLKVELGNLKRYLKQNPTNIQDLIEQNSALKQELMKIKDELIRARGCSRIPSDDSQYNQELDALKRSYKDALLEKDHEVDRLQGKLNALSLPRAPSIPQDVLDKIEFLQNENQSLARQLDGHIATSTKTRSQFETENNDLKLKVHRLKIQLSEIPSGASEQLDHLGKSNKILEEKLKTTSSNLEKAEDERDSLRTSLRNAHSLLKEKQREIENLSRLRDEVKHSESRTSKETDSILERARHEIDDLKNKLNRTEAALTSAMEDKSSDDQRLQKKVDYLQEEIKRKDRDEKELHAQVLSLMDERNRAFDKQVTLQHYQAQIDTYRAKEKVQLEDNLRLKGDIAKLQDELYSQNIESSRSAKLRQDNAELINKLEFYEKEYALTQDAMDKFKADLELMKNEQIKYDNDKHLLETELESMRTTLRRTQLSESRKYNESAYIELEEKHRQREEAENRRMTHQIEVLNTQIQELERQLELAKQKRESSDKNYMPDSDNRLRSDLHNKDFELQEKQREISKLQEVLKDKEDLVDALECRIRKLNKELRTDFAYEDRYRENLQKLKLDHEEEVLSMRLEKDRLSSEVKLYKIQLEQLKDDDTEPASNETSITIAILTTQLDELRRKNYALQAELETASNIRQHHSSIESDEHRARISELRLSLDEARKEKSDLELMKASLESDLSLLRAEKAQVETRSRTSSQELTRSCTKLANKVRELQRQLTSMSKTTEDVYRIQKTNISLQNQVDQLGTRLASTNLSSQSQQPALNMVKTRLNENELRYYKAKLFELQMRYMDLASMNSIMISSIKTSSETCKDDLVKMAISGIYPDYSALRNRNKKMTLKALATFVLSTVRIKRRMEMAKTREGKLNQLRGEIERDRITLLVENP